MTTQTTTETWHYAVDELLRDGGSVHFRCVRRDDKERLRAHFHTLSRQSVYTRFFGPKRDLSPAELEYFTDVDGVERVGLLVTLRSDGEERIIGVGRYFREKGARHRAEVAFAVSDNHQRRGIATVLLEHLARIARRAGITEFSADVLGENNRMLDVFNRSGFSVSRSIERGVFHLTFPTADTPEHREISHERERHAAAESVRPFFLPKSVAVVGASRRAGSIGALLMSNLASGGFRGPVYPVNPNAAEIQGHRAFPSVSAIGEPVELAVIATPAALVPGAVADCVRAGVRAVVVISAGFSETGAQGRANERELLALVRGSGMRMVGPNCMGVLNADPAVSFNATFAPALPPPGCVAMLSQSGALGLAILDMADRLGIGLSSFVSVGNKADVSSNDMLAYWAEDPQTKVVLLYLESFGNPRKFARVVPEVARAKPVVAVKSGRSAAGRRAASSHSAALGSLDIAVEALFEQSGVIRTDTMEQLFDVAALLASQPVPAGPRVAVVTNAGGPGILLADACEALGLVLPELSPESRASLAEFLPAHAGLGNPVDVLAAATPEQYQRALEVVGKDPAFDSVIVVHIPVLPSGTEEIAGAIARGAAAIPADRPVLVTFLSSTGTPQALSEGPRGRLPSYAFPENAAFALSAAVGYSQWLQRAAGTPHTLTPFARSAVRAIVERVLEGADAPVWLGVEDLAAMLRACDIALAESVEVTPEAAAVAAEHLGYPLVAKVTSPPILHKSDVGAVVLHLHSADDVREAVAAMRARLAARGQVVERVLLQREIAGGIETLVGVTVDPVFGPLVVVGMGGVLVELLKDVAFHLVPVSDVDAEEMLAKLRSSALLAGYRGAPPGDRAALVGLIQRVSALVEALPELVELDLNPVKVLTPGSGAMAVDGRLRLAPLFWHSAQLQADARPPKNSA